jgi:ABC-type branched-subunit amino acid transport system ATPase component
MQNKVLLLDETFDGLSPTVIPAIHKTKSDWKPSRY